MKKLKIVLSLVLLLALAACSEAEGGAPSPLLSPSPTNQGIAYNELTFEVLENEQGLPEDITGSIGSLKANRGFAYFKTGEECVVFIGMGEKLTGGYSLEVKTVEDIEGLTKITVEEKAPQKDARVTQAITYPYALVKIKGCAENFEVVTAANEKLPLIEQNNDSGNTQGQANNNSTAQPQAAQTMGVAVYYLKSNDNEIYLVREVHQVKKSEGVARAALNELIKGEPVTQGAYRVLPAETEIRGISIDSGLATVDFSGDVLKANVGAAGEALGISSIVNTLTEFPTIQKVQFTVDGQAEKGMDWWGHVGLYEQPFERNLSSVYEPTIWVTAPVIGQTITSPVKIAGNARVFEATVSFRLKDADGNILAQGCAQASEGAPGRGDFSAELAYTAQAAGKGQLEVFEVSMKDGSDLNVVVIPVEIR